MIQWIRKRWVGLTLCSAIVLNGCAVLDFGAGDIVRVRMPQSAQEVLGLPANASVKQMVEARNSKVREIMARRAAEDEQIELADATIRPRADFAVELDTAGGTLLGVAFEQVQSSVNLPAKFGGFATGIAALMGLLARQRQREDALWDEAESKTESKIKAGMELAGKNT